MGIDARSGGFQKMTQGDNTKKNQEVESLYTKYGLSKDDQRKVHDMITGKGLSRDQIERVIKDYKGIDCGN